MSEHATRLLLIGCGNPGRLDDGLGPALAERLEAAAPPGVTVDADYQLNVEHAAAVAEHDVVVFADAAAAGPEPFFFRAVVPGRGGMGFSSHSVSPAGVLALARELFGSRAKGYVLGIRGYCFDEFGERLSPRARVNLAAAERFLRRLLSEPGFALARCEPGRRAGAGEAPRREDQTCKTASQ